MSDIPRTSAWFRGKDAIRIAMTAYDFAAQLERELIAMTGERNALKRMSTVEMMCENMNVDHHVTEWENRCLKAEAEVERLKAERDEWKLAHDCLVEHANAENESLRAEWKVMEMNWINVGKDNERLRALLRECSRGYAVEMTVNIDNTWASVMADRIRAALGEDYEIPRPAAE